MNSSEKFGDDIKKLREFVGEHVVKINKIITELNKQHAPITFMKNRPLVIIIAFIALILIIIYPLLSVWFLACAGTGYPGYRIIRSMMDDRDEAKQLNIRQQEIREFLHKSMNEQKIIQIPIRHNSKIIHRSVLIRGEFEDGISVKDPETGIQSKYPWSNIDLNSFYMSYIRSSNSE